MPKIQSPFVRENNDKGDYVVTPEITEGYDWVFKDDSVLAIEKLHGTNVSIIIEDGVVTSLWNRTARIPFFNKGKSFITKSVLESFDRGYCELPDGLWFGETIGPKINGNPYQLKEPVWIPFKTYAAKHLAYTSWGKYPKTFESMSEWFQTLMPLYSLRVHGKDATDKHFVEGVVFTHPDGKMAKLRKDMFPDFKGTRHKGGKHQQ